MADPRDTTGGIDNSGGRRHLDATGPREVVYCHQCENEWYKDEHGLVCPRCEGEIIEIVDPNSDPRRETDNSRFISPLRDLDNHNPWADDSDPEEADIEEHITHGPHGSIMISQTIRSTRPVPFGGNFNTITGEMRRRRSPGGGGGDDDTMRDFQSMLGNLMGPNLRSSRTGRSGNDDLFPRAEEFHTGGGGAGFGMGGGRGPHTVGGRYTFEGRFENGRLRPRDANSPQAQGAPVEDLATLISHLFAQIGAVPAPGTPGEDDEPRRGMPFPGVVGLPGLLQTLFSHQNAVHGDAVYSQEAFDRIMSQLMEQHQQSNAPGPASPDAISALPKKALDEKMLGPEGRGECSVCMDDVFLATEVVVLPCKHWFHEACASAWLSEHNTCPICRKGIGAEEASSSRHVHSGRSSNSTTPQSANSPSNRRPRLSRLNSEQDDLMARNQARLDFLRNSRFTGPSSASPSSERREVERHAERVAEQATEDGIFPNSSRSEHIPGMFPGSNTSTSTLYRRDPGLSTGTNEPRRGTGSSGQISSRDRPRSERSESDSSVRGDGNGNGGLAGWFRDRWRRQE
ncbi:5dc06aef-1085-420f-9dbc-2f1c63fa7372 [Sclerotinia trifoliorum]|uniref:RING-type E3 ubiquitin transferase n=1 Tax=Sclerotinia trifoliorum TaxID=28548 RepID=A0A8H2ZNP6_9HELO|nr:5dc06aef-1085-420f-9dbc-2f1c63fa7372 [Sclerotinia trifoliorum]